MPLSCILVWVPRNLSQDNPFAAVDQLYLYIALATKKFELCPLYSTNFHRFHCHFDLLLKVLAILQAHGLITWLSHARDVRADACGSLEDSRRFSEDSFTKWSMPSTKADLFDCFRALVGRAFLPAGGPCGYLAWSLVGSPCEGGNRSGSCRGAIRGCVAVQKQPLKAWVFYSYTYSMIFLYVEVSGVSVQIYLMSFDVIFDMFWNFRLVITKKQENGIEIYIYILYIIYNYIYMCVCHYSKGPKDWIVPNSIFFRSF